MTDGEYVWEVEAGKWGCALTISLNLKGKTSAKSFELKYTMIKDNYYRKVVYYLKNI
jgi:hypothetical protein